MKSAAVLALVTPALADVATLLQSFETTLDGWNVVSGDWYAPAGGSVEGRLASGGDCTLGSYSVGSELGENAAQVDFVCSGLLDFVGGTVQNSFVYNTNTSALPGYLCSTAGCTITRDSDYLDVPTLLGDFSTLATDLAAEPATGSVTGSWSTYYLVGSEDTHNVFEMTDADLADATSMDLNVPEGSFTLINVAGTTVDLTSVANNNDFTRRRGMTVFNLYEATHVTVTSTSLEGSLLAPLAHLEFPAGTIRGDVVVASMSGAASVAEAVDTDTTGQFMLQPFDNTATGETDGTGTPPTCDFTISRADGGPGNGDTLTMVSSALSSDTDGNIVTYYWIVSDIGDGTLVDAFAADTDITGLLCTDTPTVEVACTDDGGNTVYATAQTSSIASDACSDDDAAYQCTAENGATHVWDDTLEECVCNDRTQTYGDSCEFSCSTDLCNGNGLCNYDDNTICDCFDTAAYAGDHCELDAATSCSGNGLFDDSGSCECFDPQQFSGADCGTDADTACNGKGNFGAGDGVCVCYNGYAWTGADCNTASAYQTGACENGVWDVTSQTCSCNNDPDNSEGLYHFYGDSCASCLSYCSDHGLCNSDGEAPTCTCFDSRWSGDLCEIYTATDDDAGVYCFHSQDDCVTCDDGWSGEFCDSYTPCYHGDWIDDVCTCDSGWSGDDCNTYNILPNPDEALLFGSCVNGDDSSGTCLCNDRWFGDNCNTFWCSNGIMSDSDSDGVDDTCTCIPGFTSDNEDDELYCEVGCRATCNWLGTVCDASDPGVCVCDSGWSGATCNTFTATDGSTFTIPGGAAALVSGGAAAITLDVDSGNAGTVVGDDVVLGDVAIDIVSEARRLLDADRFDRRLDDVEYSVTISFADSVAYTPTLVDAAGETDCVDETYDADERVLSATVCGSGTYQLGSVQAIEAGDDTTANDDNASGDENDDAESSSSDSSDFPAAAVGGGIGVGVLAGAVLTMRRRRAEKIVDGSNAPGRVRRKSQSNDVSVVP